MEDLEASSAGRRSGELLGGRHRLGRLLGEGGFGVVYEAQDELSGRKVAVKLLHAHLVDVREVASRFRREAATMEAVRHPHVVEVLDGGTTDDGTMYFAMERLEGEELSALLERTGPMRVGPAVRIAMQIADALAAVHAVGIVHRDLKPDNVFLVDDGTRDPHVKLLDFGVAKVLDATSQVSMATRTGTTIGTAYYMSPEQAQARKDLDARSDLYALGVILFRMLSGAHPFEDDSYPLLVVKICTEPPPPLTAYRGDVPLALARLVDSLLSKHPEQRPADATSLRLALAPFAELDVEPVLLPGTDRSAAPRALRIESPLAHAPTQVGTEGALELDDEAVEKALRGGSSLGLRFGVALAMVALLGVAGFFLLRGTERAAPAREQVSLPRPMAPIEQRMFESAATEDGWRFLNPLPRALPTFHDVAIAGPGNVAFVGRAGAVYLLADRRMTRLATHVDAGLYGVAWVGADELVAVGERGSLVDLRGGVARIVPTHVDDTLRGVAILAPREWVLVGDRGAFVRVVGERASSVDVGVEVDLLAVTRHGEDVFAVGTDGTVLRWDRRSVSLESSGTRRVLRAVGGCPGGDLYAVGDEGTVLRRRSDGRWGPVATRSRETYGALACRDGRMLAAGARGGVLVIEASQSVRLDSGDERAFYGIDAAPGAGVWVVGAGGRLAGVGDDRVVRTTSGPTRTLFDVASLSGALVAVGADGTVLRETERGFVEMRSPIGAGLGGAAALDAQTVIAVGDVGSLLAVRHDAVRAIASPTQQSLRDVVAGDGRLLSVGTEGTVLRGAEGAFVVTQLAGVGTLRALAGTVDDAIAVGDAGAVVRITATAATPVPCDVGKTLRGVVRSGALAFAVGDDGVFVRIDAQGCTVERRGGADLYAIGPAPSGGLLAAGRGGATLLRNDDGSFAPGLLEAGGYDVHTVFADDRNVVLAGASGLVLRRARLVVP